MVVRGGVASTIQVQAGGLGSRRGAGTDTAQRPCASAVTVPMATPSRVTATRAPGSAVPESVGVRTARYAPGAGASKMGAPGGVWSTTQLAAAGAGSTLPAR